MTNEELEKLNQKLDKLDVKLDVLLTQNKSSSSGYFFKGCGLLILIVLFLHVLVIGGLSAYSLLKEDSSTATVTNPPTQSPATPVK